MPKEADNHYSDNGLPPEAESEVGFTAPELFAQPHSQPNEHFSDKLHFRIDRIKRDARILGQIARKADPADIARNYNQY